MYLVKNPSLLKKVFPSLLWKVKTKEKELYLTFDDGPHPTITPWVLDVLDQYKAKATFFCVGENVEKYPEVYQDILRRGHSVGNHTQNHLNGWKTPTKEYVKNTELCAKAVQSELFRPPYGKIKTTQIKRLKKDYQIVMWTVISADFDQNIMPEECLNIVMQNADYGNIIVFHDSEKAETNMRYALTRVL
ncbi:MAG: polysaccharide deacetylase family protein, partial [Bacteroidetes bacterium]|nr:polysaccharide deacetylase family protein [Bacteroidota bacterium]